MKPALRSSIDQKLKNASSQDIREWSLAIHQLLGEIPEFFQAKNPCIYLSLSSEVDTKDLINNWSHEKEFSVPKWAGESFIPVKFNGWENIEKNRWGVEEPIKIEEVQLPSIDCILVPGLAFTKGGERLGRGMGFYDRFLTGIKVPKIGLAFELQILEEIPQDPWDQLVDLVVTEKQVYKQQA
jgi:5-formyltetrahydrofolate cyclo-ligase